MAFHLINIKNSIHYYHLYPMKCILIVYFIPGTKSGPISRPPRSLLPRSLLPLSLLPRSLLPLSRLPLSRLSVMLATRRTGSVEALLSPPLPPRSCDSLLKLLLVIWFPSRPSLRSNRSNCSLLRSLLSLSLPRSRLELDLLGRDDTKMYI